MAIYTIRQLSNPSKSEQLNWYFNQDILELSSDIYEPFIKSCRHKKVSGKGKGPKKTVVDLAFTGSTWGFRKFMADTMATFPPKSREVDDLVEQVTLEILGKQINT